MKRLFSRQPAWSTAALAAVFAIGISGCGADGPEVVEVEGTVLVDDRPLDMALVKFIPESGMRQSVAMTDDQGKYRLRFTNDRYGAVPGRHKVIITSAVPASPDDGLGKPFPGRKEILPKKYNDETELVAEVSASNTTFDFNLTPK
jgi:hypothetical protein